MESQSLNYLLLLSGNYYISSQQDLAELNYLIYDVANMKIIFQSLYNISPPSFTSEELKKEFAKHKQKNNTDYLSIEQAKEKLFAYLKSKYIDNNLNIGIIYHQNNLIENFNNLIPDQNLKSFNLFELFINLYKNKFGILNKIKDINELNNIEDILIAFNFKLMNNPKRKSSKNLDNMARVVNKIVKDGNKILIKKNNYLNILNTNLININILKQMDIDRAQLKKYYIRFKNFPIYIEKPTIIDLLSMYSIPENDIVLSYDFFGRKTGNCIIRTFHKETHSNILTQYNFFNFNNEIILELFEAEEIDYAICEKSEQFLYKNIYNIPINETINPSNNKNFATNINSLPKIFIKITKIPYTSTELDIKNFFKNHLICENGIVINKNRKGNSKGEAIIAFFDENESQDVMLREKGRIFKNQIINLEYSNLIEYEEFASSNSFDMWIKCLSEFVSADDVERCLYISNLPLDIDEDTLLDWLQIFNINSSDLVINQQILFEYGSVIVKFYNEEDANKAKEYLVKGEYQWKGRVKKLVVENLLFVVNKGNEG